MKFTLLEIVQDILNDISGDEVDSINDTTEATQIANIVKSTYFHIISQRNLPEHKTLFRLDETTSATPTVLTMPADILDVDWIAYDMKNSSGAFSGGVFGGSAFDTFEGSSFSQMQYLPPNEFFSMISKRVWDGTTILSYTFTGARDTHEVKYYADRNPTFYTVLEDYYYICDAIDLDVSPSYLTSDLTMGYGTKMPTFTLSDSFTPDIDASEFNWLMEEAKSAASIKLRQVDDPVASRRARRGWVHSMTKSQNAQHTSFFDSLPNYGRKR